MHFLMAKRTIYKLYFGLFIFESKSYHNGMVKQV